MPAGFSELILLASNWPNLDSHSSNRAAQPELPKSMNASEAINSFFIPYKSSLCISLTPSKFQTGKIDLKQFIQLSSVLSNYHFFRGCLIINANKFYFLTKSLQQSPWGNLILRHYNSSVKW